MVRFHGVPSEVLLSLMAEPIWPSIVNVPVTVCVVPAVIWISLPAVAQERLLNMVEPDITETPDPVNTTVLAPVNVPPPVLEKLPPTLILPVPEIVPSAAYTTSPATFTS